MNPNRTGLVVGSLLGGMHALWALLVATGWGQIAVDFVSLIHFVEPETTVRAFDATMALWLVAVTSVIGYATGYLFAFAWNRFARPLRHS